MPRTMGLATSSKRDVNQLIHTNVNFSGVVDDKMHYSGNSQYRNSVLETQLIPETLLMARSAEHRQSNELRFSHASSFLLTMEEEMCKIKTQTSDIMVSRTQSFSNV